MTFAPAEARSGDLIEVSFRLDVNGEAVPGRFFLPEDGGPFPLVVMQHPATGSKDDYFVRDVAMLWARRGWMCGGLDAPRHGERDHYDPMSVLRDRDAFGALSAQFGVELTAVVDALAGHYPLDPSRLGFVGYSMGSMLGIPAVAADGRFKAAAFCLVGEGGLLGTAGSEQSPVQQLHGVAVRIVAKTQDEFFSREATQGLYDALPGEKDLVWKPGGHFEIGPDVIRAAEEWMVAKL